MERDPEKLLLQSCLLEKCIAAVSVFIVRTISSLPLDPKFHRVGHVQHPQYLALYLFTVEVERGSKTGCDQTIECDVMRSKERGLLG